MLPPIDPSTLQSNPLFATLYKRLITSILNVDGSVKISAEEARSQARLDEDLITAQTAAAKISILRSLLHQLLTPDLSPELQDLITLLSHPTTHPLHPASLLPTNPFLLAPLLSAPISSLHAHLSLIADPESDPPPPLTAAYISTRRASLAAAQRELDRKRLALADVAGGVLEVRRKVDEEAVTALEGVKFGTVARGMSAEVGYLAVVAEGMAEKLRVTTLELLQTIYTPELVAAITSYNTHLAVIRAHWTARAATAARKLEEYEHAAPPAEEEQARRKGGGGKKGRGKEGVGMQAIARQYADLIAEAESLKAQIRRLGGEV